MKKGSQPHKDKGDLANLMHGPLFRLGIKRTRKNMQFSANRYLHRK